MITVRSPSSFLESSSTLMFSIDQASSFSPIYHCYYFQKEELYTLRLFRFRLPHRLISLNFDNQSPFSQHNWPIKLAFSIFHQLLVIAKVRQMGQEQSVHLGFLSQSSSH